MNKQKLIIIAAAILAVVILILLFSCPPTPRDRSGAKPKAKTGTQVTKKQKEKPVISPEQRQNLEKIHAGLRLWQDKYRNSGEIVFDIRYTDAKLEDFLEGDNPNPYSEFLSRGSIIRLLHSYLTKLRLLKIQAPEDQSRISELSSLYNILKDEPDRVSISVVNQSGRSISYYEDTVAPGGRKQFSGNRKPGEIEIQEGAFSIDGKSFPYNPKLRDPDWDQTVYLWAKTGISSYSLTIRK